MAPQYLQSLSKEKKTEFIDSFDTIVSDCDGVIWRPEGTIPGAVEVVNELINCGKRIFFITNNSTKSREQFYAKIQKFGFNVPKENLYNTSSLVAQYVQQNLPSDKYAYVVGSTGIATELDLRHVKYFGVGKDDMYEDFFENVNSMNIDIRKDVGAVVVGFDQYINYVKTLKAVTYLRNKDVQFICTNTDEVFPTQGEIVLPGTGSIVASIQVASGREPYVVGKPSTYIAQALKEEKKINPSRTLFIGDRCNTDIRMGNLCSYTTLLVLSGVHTIADVERYESSPTAEDQQSVPEYYTDSIYDLCMNKK